MTEIVEFVEFVHAHLFAGLGGGASGFNRGKARLGNREVRYRCAGGIDIDPGAIQAFTARAGVPGTVMDLFNREQYTAFHGHEPPAIWREATPADVRAAFGNQHVHCLFGSSPCKGYSGLLPEKSSRTPKYQALNELALRGVLLALEAFKEDPCEFILFENVPRIATRGRPLLDQIMGLLHAYGYAAAETEHCCGELGGLAQVRRRFLLVARHVQRVPPFLYEPQKKPLISVGRLLEKFALPGDPVAGPMHRIPQLQWKTWVRLAFVEAGSDWRSLQKLRVENGMLADYALAPGVEYHSGPYGVRRWDESSNTVTGNARASTGAFSVADPRVDVHDKSVQLGVRPWSDTGPTITGQMWPAQGPFSVADPRLTLKHNNCFRVIRWDEVSRAVTGGTGPSAGGLAVSDPRPQGWPGGKYRVARFEESSGTVIGASTTGNGAFSVADPRVGYGPNSHRNKLAVMEWNGHARTVTSATQVQGGALSIADPRTGLNRPSGTAFANCGHYGVVPWTEPSGTVTARISHDRGVGNVADPRLPALTEQLTCLIIAADQTWHRPFTTLELAALQGLVEPDECPSLPGKSDSQWREWIGNACPPPACTAIASEMGRALLLAISGETFVLSATPVWVRPIAVAIAAARREGVA